MLKPSSVKKKFLGVLRETEAGIHRFVRSPGKDMTRHRSCTFTDTVLATMTMSSWRTNTELLGFFGDRGRRVVSKSAFCQQRGKLSDALFPHILEEFNRATPMRKRFKGYRLVAADGTDVNIPTDAGDAAFAVRQARSDGHYYQMHANALYDICEDRYLDMEVQPRPAMNENAALLLMAGRLGDAGRTAVVADRGYATLNTFAALGDGGLKFVIRCKSPDSRGSLLSGLAGPGAGADATVTFGITRSHRKCYSGSPGRFKCLGAGRTFEPIPPGDRETVYSMTLRIVAVETAGGTEYLATNIWEDELPAQDIGEIYRRRWGIETSFRSLKHALSLVYFHSVKREFVIQELYAKTILYNIASLLRAYAEHERGKREQGRSYRHPHRVSFDDAVPVARRLLRTAMSNAAALGLLLMHLSSVREGKPGPRKVRSQSAKPLNCRA